MGRLQEFDKHLNTSADWQTFTRQVNKLRDLMPGETGVAYVGVCGCSSFYRALNGQDPTPRDLEQVATWRERAAGKIKHIEGGGDPHEFRVQNKRRKDSKEAPPRSEFAVCKELFDILMEQITPAFRDAVLKTGGELSPEVKDRLELAKHLVQLHPSIDD